MSVRLTRSGFRGLNIIEQRLLDVESTNDILKLLSARKADILSKLRIEHGYSDAQLKEDLGNDILT